MIYVTGDSHGLIFKNCDLCTYNPLGPYLAWTFSKHVDNINATINNNKIKNILVCLGEIDCRFHIGRQIKKRINESKDDIIKSTVDAYTNALVKCTQNNTILVGAWGPPGSSWGPQIPHQEYPREGTEQERNCYSKLFNDELKEQCESKNLIYLSIFDKLINQDFTTNRQFYLNDTVHLNPSVVIPIIRPMLISAFTPGSNINGTK